MLKLAVEIETETNIVIAVRKILSKLLFHMLQASLCFFKFKRRFRRLWVPSEFIFGFKSWVEFSFFIFQMQYLLNSLEIGYFKLIKIPTEIEKSSIEQHSTVGTTHRTIRSRFGTCRAVAAECENSNITFACCLNSTVADAALSRSCTVKSRGVQNRQHKRAHSVIQYVVHYIEHTAWYVRELHTAARTLSLVQFETNGD